MSSPPLWIHSDIEIDDEPAVMLMPLYTPSEGPKRESMKSLSEYAAIILFGEETYPE
jgi:hypothetical protein